MVNLTIGIKISLKERDLLDQVCEARGEGISNFVRRAIRIELTKLGYYPAETRKALGLLVVR